MNYDEINVTYPRVRLVGKCLFIDLSAKNKEVESYNAIDVDSHQKILRYTVLLLEKEWVKNRLILEFIKLASSLSNLQYR